MACNECSILHQVLCIAVGEHRSPLEKCKEILACLERSLPVAGAFFWYPESASGVGTAIVAASDANASPPCERPRLFATQSSDGCCPVASPPGFFHVAAMASGRELGILSFCLADSLSLAPSVQQLAGNVSMILADQLRQHLDGRSQQQTLRHALLLADLARALGGTADLESLLNEIWRVLESDGGVACVILRPLHGAAVLGRSQVRLSSHRQADLGTFEDMELDLGARVLADTRMHLVAGSGMAAKAVCWPLVFQGRLRGTLFLAEDGRCGALDLGTRQSFLHKLAGLAAQNLERLEALQDRTLLLRENTRKLHEISLLYRISRAMHGTLRLDELMHLILSAVTISWGGGFERAMLFLANERSGVLQGMVGVTHVSARYLFCREEGEAEWELPTITADICERQRQDEFCQKVFKQRLSLSDKNNPLARALLEDRLIFITDTRKGEGSFGRLSETLGFDACAVVPLRGRSRALGVLVVNSSSLDRPELLARRRFLELFANQAAQAMENSMLLSRLETSHQDLRETQERLIQGEKMAALGETAASVTHELRNPLVCIGGFARRLANVLPEASREREYSEIIVREVRRMEEMLTNILAFSKKQMLCISECDIIKMLDEVLILEDDSLRKGNIRLVREFGEDVPPVQGDVQKLRQVVINLIDNARQAMPEGGSLVVRAYSTVLRGDRAAAVEIEDTGGGIPVTILRNIFNPFFTTRKQGTGLGLSIVHRILEHHRGEIEVQNTELGARFVLRLPHTSPSCQALDRHRPFS